MVKMSASTNQLSGFSAEHSVTGILPHTTIIKYLNEVLAKLRDILLKVDNFYVGLKKVVLDVIEEKMVSNGHLSNY